MTPSKSTFQVIIYFSINLQINEQFWWPKKIYVGFKRQQLKVLLSSSGNLTITGERQSDEDKLKISRFRKEFPVSKDCQQNQIEARFSNGILYLVISKEISTISGTGENVTASGTCLSSLIMNRNKRIAMEIFVAISFAVAVGAYVKKYCQCSQLCNWLIVLCSFNKNEIKWKIYN